MVQLKNEYTLEYRIARSRCEPGSSFYLERVPKTTSDDPILWSVEVILTKDSAKIVLHGFLQESLQDDTMIIADVHFTFHELGSSADQKVLFFNKGKGCYAFKDVLLDITYQKFSDSFNASHEKTITLKIFNLKCETFCLSPRLQMRKALDTYDFSFTHKFSSEVKVEEVEASARHRYGILDWFSTLKVSDKAAEISLCALTTSDFDRDCLGGFQKVTVDVTLNLVDINLSIFKKVQFICNYSEKDYEPKAQVIAILPIDEIEPKLFGNLFTRIDISMMEIERFRKTKMVKDLEHSGSDDFNFSHQFDNSSETQQSEFHLDSNIKWILSFSSVEEAFNIHIIGLPDVYLEKFHPEITVDVAITVGETGAIHRLNETIYLHHKNDYKDEVLSEKKKFLDKSMKNGKILVNVKISNMRIDRFWSTKYFCLSGLNETENVFCFSHNFKKSMKNLQKSSYNQNENTQWSLAVEIKNNDVEIVLFGKPREEYVCPDVYWEITADIQITVGEITKDIEREVKFASAFEKNCCVGRILSTDSLSLLCSETDQFLVNVKILNMKTIGIRQIKNVKFRDSSSKGTDCSLEIGKEKLFCHSQILSQNSSVFNNMFFLQKKKCLKLSLGIQNSIKDFQQFLHQLYYPVEPVRENNVHILFQFAKKFAAFQVLKVCESFLVNLLLNSNNIDLSVEDIFLLAWKFDLKDLKTISYQKCQCFKKKTHRRVLVNSETFISLEDTEKLQILEYIISKLT